jgi:5'-nucleotidase
MTGADLLAGLENGFSQIESGAGRMPQVSGLVIEVDATKAAGAACSRAGQRPAARSG